jgi:hypothetical protein
MRQPWGEFKASGHSAGLTAATVHPLEAFAMDASILNALGHGNSRCNLSHCVNISLKLTERMRHENIRFQKTKTFGWAGSALHRFTRVLRPDFG